jgi:hypothetical protein
MTTRILPPEEWTRLASTNASEAWACLDPQRNSVLVVEAEGEIIGSVILMQAVHAEFLWIDPKHRKRASVLRRLRRRLLLEVAGIPTVLAAAIGVEMRTLLEKLGGHRLPGDHYVLNVQEMSCLQR